MTKSPVFNVETYRPGPHWVAVVAALFTWPLLFVGGLVTSYKVGMAVPDWPTTFGINMFVYDFFNSPWGVFIEHTHRLYGAAVGLATIILVIWFSVCESSNRRMVGIAWFALLAVIVQGLLGGLRVNWNSTILAAVHGCSGQAFFGLMVTIAVLTSHTYRDRRLTLEDDSRLRAATLGLVGLIYAQELAGAWVRHFPSRLALVVHGVAALAVVGHATRVICKILHRRDELKLLMTSTLALILTLTGQVALGLMAWWVLEIPRQQKDLSALIRTGHQANAALLLGSSVALAVLAHRFLRPLEVSEMASSLTHAELEAIA